MTLFHYYTYYKSVREIDRAEVAVASVFLACKFEYTFLKVEEATEFYKKLKISKGLSQSCGHNPDFTKFEVDILTFIGYEMDIETPHRNFYYYLERNFQNLLKDQRVLNFGLKLINDSYRSNMCIFFSSKYIALASLFITLNSLEIIGFEKFEINKILLCDKTINKSIFLSCMDNLFKVLEMSIVNKEVQVQQIGA